MRKIRQIESALRFLWVEVEPRKGGIWLVLSRILRRVPLSFWAFFERYCLNQSQLEFFQLLRSVGGLHFAPVDLASVAEIHRFRSPSDAKFCFVVERGVNARLLAAILNNLFEPCVLIKSADDQSHKLMREFRRLLGIQTCKFDPASDLISQISQLTGSGKSVIISTSEFIAEELKMSAPSNGAKYLSLTWSPIGKAKYAVKYEILAS